MDEKRPETPESGVPLEKECNIQHRSDLLMEHHVSKTYCVASSWDNEFNIH